MRGPTGRLLHRGLAVLALVTLTGMTACSGDDPKAGRVPSPTAASTTASPSPTTPEAQIEAAVRAYYAELTRATQTQDTTELATMSTRGCSCYNIVLSIERLSDRGHTTPTASWTLRSVRVHDLVGGTGQAEVRYTVSSYDVLNRDGAIIHRYEEQTGHDDLSFVRHQGRWVIGSLFNLES